MRGILFDLDGVLLDTEGIYTEFWKAIDETFPTGVENFAQVIKGSNLERILNTYFQVEKHARIVEMLNTFQHDMEYRFFPGALDVLQALNDRQIKCCLVTSSDKKKMEAVDARYPSFRNFFTAVVTGEMVSNPKPSPECFLLGAKLIGEDIRECTVVEDSLNGLEAGMASGAEVVGIATTLPAGELEGKAHHVIPSIADLKGLMFKKS